MKFFTSKSIVCLIFLFISQLVVAETIFIKDQLKATLYPENPNVSGFDGQTSTLNSGETVEVLMQEGQYSKVRYKDREGWLESNLLTKEKPQKIRYLQLLGKYKKVTAELQGAQAKLSTMKDSEKEVMAMGKLNLQLKQAKEKIAELETQLKQLPQEETAPAGEMAAPTPAPNTSDSAVMTPIPALWAGISMVICLLLGLYMGYTYLDRAIAKRHGGVQIR